MLYYFFFILKYEYFTYHYDIIDAWSKYSGWTQYTTLLQLILKITFSSYATQNLQVCKYFQSPITLLLALHWSHNWISISILASLDHNRNKTVILTHAMSCVVNAVNPSISTCALRSAQPPHENFRFQPHILPVRVLKKRVEEDGRRWQKCSLWLGRKVKRILWCWNTLV